MLHPFAAKVSRYVSVISTVTVREAQSAVREHAVLRQVYQGVIGMGTHRMRPAGVLAALLAAIVAFFLIGGVASAQGMPATSSGDGVSIDLGGDSGPADPSAAGANASDEITAVTTEGGAVIELVPGVSKEITPQEAAEAGQGSTADTASAAGVDGPASMLWILGGAAVLIAGAFAISRIGTTRATR